MNNIVTALSTAVKTYESKGYLDDEIEDDVIAKNTLFHYDYTLKTNHRGITTCIEIDRLFN